MGNAHPMRATPHTTAEIRYILSRHRGRSRSIIVGKSFVSYMGMINAARASRGYRNQGNHDAAERCRGGAGATTGVAFTRGEFSSAVAGFCTSISERLVDAKVLLSSHWTSAEGTMP